MKIYRNPEAMWREEAGHKEQAVKELEEGKEAEGIGTSVLFLNGTMLTLNLLGTEIWGRCDGVEQGDLVAGLARDFEVDIKTLEADVTDFLGELKEKGFIRYEHE